MRRTGSTTADSKDEDAVSSAVLAGSKENDIPVQSAELLRKLISFKEINTIAGKRSNWEGLKQTAFHGGCMVVTGLILRNALSVYRLSPSTGSLIYVLVSMLLHGYVLSFLFMPLHECVHLTAFRSPWLNKMGGFLTGLATLRPPFHYKLYHFAHHRYTGNRDMDPELSDSLLDPDIKGMSGYLLYLSSIPFWFSRPLTVLRHAFSGPASMDPKSEHYIATYDQQAGIATEARIFVLMYLILLYCSLSLGSNALLLYWVIPTIIGQPFLRFYLIAEHTGCQLGPNMIANTRTTKTYGFYRKLAWNMPYHAEHHAWPSVPFHSLPLVHSLIKGVSLTESGCAPTGKDGYFGVHAGVRKTFK